MFINSKFEVGEVVNYWNMLQEKCSGTLIGFAPHKNGLIHLVQHKGGISRLFESKLWREGEKEAIFREEDYYCYD